MWLQVKARAIWLLGGALALAGVLLALYGVGLFLWQYATALRFGMWVRLPASLLFADHAKLRGSDVFTKQVLRFAWHITSVAWIAMGAALVWDPRRAIAIGFAASGATALVGSRGRHYSYVVFFAIAALSWPW